jgi:hypothetical protein
MEISISTVVFWLMQPVKSAKATSVMTMRNSPFLFMGTPDVYQMLLNHREIKIIQGGEREQQDKSSASNSLSSLTRECHSRETVPFCQECGKEIPEGALHCDACGASSPELKAEGIDFSWGTKTPVVTSTIVVKQLILALGAGILLVFIILALADISAALGAAPVLIGLFLFFVVLALIIAAGIQFFTKGGPYMEYAVTREGIGYRAGDESRALNRATLIGTAIGGSLSGTGGSLINIAREMDFMSWDEIRSATAYRRDHSILLYRKALVSPFAVYCTPEIFERLIALIRERAPQARLKFRSW